MAVKYFSQVWANAGDVSAIPDAVDPSGNASYTAGFNSNFSRNLQTDPLAKSIPRTQFNQLMNDVTGAIQQIQQAGVPVWISTAMNDGTAYAYAKYSRVLYTDGHVYESLKSANTVTPTNDGINWRIVDGSAQRIVLTANTTFYVATTGNDTTGDGSSGNPWATILHAIQIIQNRHDLNGYVAYIQLANGTYTAGFYGSGSIIGSTGFGSIVLLGNTGSPSSVVISTTSVPAVYAGYGMQMTISGVTLQTTTSGYGVQCEEGATIAIGAGVVFGTCAGAHIFSNARGIVLIDANYTISGNAPQHWICQTQSLISLLTTPTITLSGSLAFTTFVEADFGSVVWAQNITFSGTATGTRYAANQNSVINTAGGGASYFPGGTAGTTTTGGQYV